MKTMGHDSEKTTEIYLKSLECYVINKTNHDLFPCCRAYCMPPKGKSNAARGDCHPRTRNWQSSRAAFQTPL